MQLTLEQQQNIFLKLNSAGKNCRTVNFVPSLLLLLLLLFITKPLLRSFGGSFLQNCAEIQLPRILRMRLCGNAPRNSETDFQFPESDVLRPERDVITKFQRKLVKSRSWSVRFEQEREIPNFEALCLPSS